MDTVLLTGGLGYIGCHIYLELIDRGYNVVILDNLSNSSFQQVYKLERITKRPVEVVIADYGDANALKEIFSQNKIEAVIHLAALKEISGSIKQPLLYYQNNFCALLDLIKMMEMHNIFNLIFSSSAAVYGIPDFLPVKEEAPLRQFLTPYANTKVACENLLCSLTHTDRRWKITSLRYFNPVGSHSSYVFGDFSSKATNLMPVLCRAAFESKPMYVYGYDYETIDGTAERDFIHVNDLASAHVEAVKHLPSNQSYEFYNVGTGTATSVKRLVEVFQHVNDVKLELIPIGRREGDVACSVADHKKISSQMRWSASKTLEEMCLDSWRAYLFHRKGVT